jgi:hypothetical protein
MTIGRSLFSGTEQLNGVIGHAAKIGGDNSPCIQELVIGWKAISQQLSGPPSILRFPVDAPNTLSTTEYAGQKKRQSDRLQPRGRCEKLVLREVQALFRSLLKKKTRHGFRGYPIATIALYGPDDTRAGKAAVAILNAEGAQPSALRRWFIEEATSGAIQRLRTKSSGSFRIMAQSRSSCRIEFIGRPHEEGIDNPEGHVCPQCPFWAHRDRWSGDMVQ